MAQYGDLDVAHRKWLIRPFIFAQIPFGETRWLDLDCRVQGSLDPIYNYANQPSAFSLARDSDGAHEK